MKKVTRPESLSADLHSKPAMFHLDIAPINPPVRAIYPLQNN